MFGRRGNLPIDFNVVTNYNPDECLKGFLQVKHLVNIFIHVQAKEEDAEAEEKRRKEMESAIKANIEKVQEKKTERIL